jgi:hypothetical protein
MPTPFKKQAEQIDKTIAQLQESKRLLLVEWIRKSHPIQVGDVVEINRGGYQGKMMQVQKRSIRQTNRGWEWVARGAVIRKKGVIGDRRGEWFEIIDA